MSTTSPTSAPLWLALHLPRLGLATVAGMAEAAHPLALYERRGPNQWLQVCNTAALRLGIAPDMAVAAALAIHGGLVLRPRDLFAEQAALEGIAAWCGQYSSRVSLEPPDAVLLEIGASLRLFGGLTALRGQILSGLEALGHEAAHGIAPTPLAALLRARAALAEPVQARAALAAALETLPIETLCLPAPNLKALRGLGIRRLGDCRRLPRGGLSRRLGRELTALLDRAYGQLPDPRPLYSAPARFERRLWLPAEVEAVEGLYFAAQRLLRELEGVLRGHSAGVQTLTLELLHAQAAARSVALGLLAPSRDAEHLFTLLRARLERLRLDAPVEGLCLRAEAFLPLAEQSLALFAEPGEHSADWRTLIERLQARLGREAVHSPALGADHRPEYASLQTAVAVDIKETPSAARPLWLIDPPEPLAVRDGRPWREGALQLRAGPERIETGWWDGREIARDYYLAEDRRGLRLWVYREIASAKAQAEQNGRGTGWYLHGLFG
jgi:protein ImuB